MEVEPPTATSHRLRNLAKKMCDRSYRHGYVASHTRQFLAKQMRAFRGDRSQAEFGELIGQTQSVISQRLENPAYGKWTLQTLFGVAEKLDVAVFVRFVDFDTFLRLSKDMSKEAAGPTPYNQDSIDDLAQKESRPSGISALDEFNKL